jgi:hypothetical protein
MNNYVGRGGGGGGGGGSSLEQVLHSFRFLSTWAISLISHACNGIL